MKTQLTVRMTWQEGKSEDFREILTKNDRQKITEMPYVGYEQVLTVGNLYISLKIKNKKNF